MRIGGRRMRLGQAGELAARVAAPVLGSASGTARGAALAAIAVAGFGFATAQRIHGSSIGRWAELFPEVREHAHVLAGVPKRVRADEWVFLTPAMLSQAAQRPEFPRRNPAFGAGDAPLFMNVPVWHWSAVFRPQH